MWDKIKQFVKDLLVELKDWVFDVFLRILKAILDGIAWVIEQIEPPDFMMNNNIGDYIHEDVGWFLVQSQVGPALAIVGSAYLFYFLRRVLTLGIW